MLAERTRSSLLIAVAATYVGGACGWDTAAEDRASTQRRSLSDKQRVESTGTSRELGHVLDQITVVTVWSQTVLAIGDPKVTAAPVIKTKVRSTRWNNVHERMRAEKRSGETCQKDYQLCPQELGGGCCPEDRVCGLSSCLPSTATARSACGRENYIACGLEAGGGCCPSNHECGRNGCTPLADALATLTCGANSFLCPATVNYGCCKKGMACGVENCYSTAASTFTLTQVITTTDANAQEVTRTTTITSTTTPTIPSETSIHNQVIGLIPKISASGDSLPKTSATPQQSSGLSSPQLGGIIGGAVTLLLALLIATFLIIRRLNKAIAVSETKSRRRASAREALSKNRPSLQESIDPFILSPTGSTELGGTPRFSAHTSPYEAEGSPVFRSPFSAEGVALKGGYTSVALADVDGGSKSERHSSLDSVSNIHRQSRV